MDKDIFLGIRLREAREFNQLTQSKLAEIIDVHRQTISAIEKNLQNPSFETTIKLSKVLDFPIEYFYKVNNYNLPRLSALTFRNKSSSSKRKKLKAEVYDNWLSNVVTFLSNYVEFPQYKLTSDIPINYKTISRDDIEDIALGLRKKLGLGIGPINNLVTLFESSGIFIGISNLPDQIDAYSSVYENSSQIMMNFSDGKAVRSRFNLAHELGHIVLHEFIDENEYYENHKEIESQANQFASSFLLPKESFVNEYFSSDIPHLIRMKKRWKVSMQAITMRAKDIGIISTDSCNNIFRRISYAGYRTIEPLDNEIEVNKPQLLKRSIELIIDNNIITKENLIESLCIPKRYLTKILNLDDNYFNNDSKIVDFKLKLKN